jgi:cytochrome c1
MTATSCRPRPLDRSRRSRSRLLPLVALATAALTVAACGGGGSTSGAPPITGEAALRGQQLAKDNGCQTCHTADGGRSTGPTWKGLAGSEVKLDGGERVVADDAYLARAITDPRAEVVAGFASIMPTRYDFSDDQVADLVAYLRELAPEPAEGPATDAG